MKRSFDTQNRVLAFLYQLLYYYIISCRQPRAPEGYVYGCNLSLFFGGDEL